MRTNVGVDLNRDDFIHTLYTHEWDVIIIGGGATGLGCAVDAASRGYKTLLLEQHDFAKASSSRSTKLIHGGVRYLQQGNIKLVREALHERSRLYKNAPHLVHHLPFLVPLYRWWETPFYTVGLKIYDMLAGKMGLSPSKHLTRRQTLNAVPSLHKEGLRGGVLYYDGQFDDARLAITLAQTAAREGATVLNYFKVTSLIKQKGKIVGVKAIDEISKTKHIIYAKVVINASGIFSDTVQKMDRPKSPASIVPSQGVHIVLPASFLRSDTAILIPHTDDGRVIFLVPWHGRVLLGTTDTPIKKPVLEPRSLAKEIDFLLKHAARYLTKPPTKADILSHFAGIRPLVKEKKAHKTSVLSRDHVITVSPAGLVTIAGGKWTTYRKMAEDTIDRAIRTAHLPLRPCTTKTLQLYGHMKGLDPQNLLSVYGADLKKIPRRHKPLVPHLPYTLDHIAWALDHEMALTLEDVLSRRIRLLLLDARAALYIAPTIARFMARHLKKSKSWENSQVKLFTQLAKRYL